MREFTTIAKALSDEHRVRALMALRRRELCLCQLVELLDLATSTMSKHMTVLRQAGLVEGVKRGRWMYYRSVGADASKMVREAVAWAYDSLAANDRIRRDLIRVKTIMECDAESRCQRRKGK